RPLEETEDMESILDECIAAGVHPTYLNWHYRSRHESLISFSNHYYYDDRLFTFPAACSSERLGIRFEFVPNGVYERKLSRTNRKEAEMLVKYVFERLENPKLKQRSIGVVTFSQAQKDLIEDLMEQERVKHPNLEAYFSDQNEEPLFVKNLENVQGDERDVICFSICYAPDAEGKFSMNFGPLNRQGGERRLNVAITRAKEQVVVFSSIHSTQIDLTRTGATGAAHLKYFLDYAEKGLHVQVKNSTGKLADGLTDTIADFLVERGFAVERAVG
ncbi:MAG: C-terminal helicase domain-containing protein, partial [Victivallaceae bacterium]